MTMKQPMPEFPDKADSKETIGRFIRRRRKELGLKQLELAHRLGLTRHNFIAILEADRAAFPMGRWKDYADALEIPRPEFLKRALEENFPEMIDYIVGFTDKPDMDRGEQGEE